MDIFSKAVRWVSVLALLLAAGWSGFHSYMVEKWVARWPALVETLPEKATMATGFVVNYSYFFGMFGVLSVVCAGYLALKVEAPVIFSVSLACAFILAAVMFNVMVVSAGFELSALAGD